MMSVLEKINELQKELDAKRPFPEHVIRNLRDHLIVEWTYHSNAIEGNTLTLSETKVILEDGITVGGKTVVEHLEAINHKDAILFLLDIVKEKGAFNERLIRDIHSLILRGIQPTYAGVYRNTNVMISGARHIPPDFLIVPQQMQELIEWYHDQARMMHSVERAAKLHSLFVKIHPFVDGNGRTARLLLNFELMKAGLMPIVIQKEQRLAYYRALDQSHVEGDFSAFIQMIAVLQLERLQFYLDFIN